MTVTRFQIWVRSLARSPLFVGYALRHAYFQLINWFERLAAKTVVIRSKIKALCGIKELEPIQQQRDRLIEFYDQYEELICILADAARYENPAPLSAKYEKQRTWMKQQYPAIKSYLVAHLMTDVSDAQHGLKLNNAPADAFEALFLAPSLIEQIELDNGDFIDRIMRTRSALNRYGDALRRAASN